MPIIKKARIFLAFISVCFVACGYNEGSNQKINNSLRFNLSNLEGEWYWEDVKNNEKWWLLICLERDNKSGRYILYIKPNNWATKEKNELRKIRSGNFMIEEGYDSYGDRAYIGKDIDNRNVVFLITQLDNKYAVDWLLRIGLVEQEQFGEIMIKNSNGCE